MRRPRRNHTAFKAKVSIAALKGEGDERFATLAEKFDVHLNQITQWNT
jgi:hypothetical protein